MATSKRQSNEQRYYDALKRISKYSPPHWIPKHGEKEWGCPAQECLEMAYENVLTEAKVALGKRRRPD
jgi:hypothetical protein